MQNTFGSRGKTIVPCLCFLFVHLLLNAQPAGSFPVIHYDRYHYRGGNQNWSVAIGEEGMVYIGNNEGLLQLDGSNWKLFSLPGKLAIRSVAIGNDHRIYTGGFEEFGYFERDHTGTLSYSSLSSMVRKELIHNDEIWRIIPSGKHIYFQSFSSIFIYDGESIESMDIPGSLVLLLRVNDRIFIHVIGSGLHELKNNLLSPVRGAGFLAGDEIKVVLPFESDKLLVGAARNGLFIYDGERFEPLSIPEAEIIRQAEINNGLLAGDHYFIGTIANGLFILNRDGSFQNHLHAGNGLQNNTILSMASDSSGNLWLGLDRGIDYIICQKAFSFYRDPSGRLGTVFDAAFCDGYLWIGTNQGLFRFLGKEPVNIQDPVMIKESQGQVWNLAVMDDELLVGHTSGTFRISGTSMKEISPVNGGFDIELYETENERVLIQGTYSNPVLYRRGPGGWEFSHNIRGIIEPLIQIEIDPYGHIWAAHLHRNVFQLTLNENLDSVTRMKKMGTDYGFPFDRNLHLAKVENRILFPTGERIYTYDDLKDTIIPYEWLNEQLGRFITSTHIIPAEKGYYWFINGQEIGYFRISGSDISRVFSCNLSLYGIHLGTDFPEIVNLDESHSLICLDDGFAIFDKVSATISVPEEITFMREVTVSDEADQVNLPLKSAADPVSIPYRQRNIYFVFSCAPHYLYPRYSFMLEGLDREWSPWSGTSRMDYVRIPPGEYVFMVRSLSINGEPGPVTRYAFTIRPPWYRSILAIICYGLFLVLIFIFSRWLFLRRLELHARRIELEEQEKIRSEKLLNEQKYTSLRNELLQSEINHKNKQLTDYTMNMIRKNEVLMKVKEELEKQKSGLGDRYPKYLYDKLIRILDASISSEDEWTAFEYHFDQTHENFFKRLRQNYRDLTPGDLKLSAYLRMNLSSKELAPLLNISIKSVEVHRSRLRKKLKLTHGENLVDFLLDF
ncbi:MAG: hypothetical protein JXR52_08385 [Bacteroidales bacterium]|nr:hypothetical protein [Bacteroidales bacterium]MBN2698829.1 hypothetical protein [Bacteroidales bacterium]